MNGLMGIWCLLCGLASSFVELCAGLSSVATKLSTISTNNLEIKTKIEMLSGDPDADCPDCPPPGDMVVAQQAVTAAMVDQTAAVQAQTAEIQTKAVAVKAAFGGAAPVKG